MKVSVERMFSGHYLKDIEPGDVFYGNGDPKKFFLRIDNEDDWVAVDIQTGMLYHREYLVWDRPQYHIVEAEVIIS